jgi:urease accessory protein
MSLARLLQLASPALPVGAFSYSQGLEWAVEDGAVRNEAQAAAWIGALLRHAVARFEAPLLASQMAAWSRRDHAEAARLNAEFLASRETAELRAETLQMGYSLRRLLNDADALDVEAATALAASEACAFPTAWSCAAATWAIPRRDAVTAYLWSWLENQVMAAVKLVPLGQTAGQRLLLGLGGELEALAAAALDLPETQWCNFTPGLAIASSRHESQYSRLFRS